MVYLKTLKRHLSNAIGRTVKGKIVVFESDDWGNIGLRDKKQVNALEKAGLVRNDDETRYIRNDTLASEEDLSALLGLLNSYRDVRGNPAVFTALAVMANPVFDKIRSDSFNTYHYEPFTDTLRGFYSHSRVIDLWRQGIENRLFIPQFHGREHLNVSTWMRALQAGLEDTLMAFDMNFFGITDRKPLNHVSYRAAFDIDDIDELNYLKDVIHSGLNLFEKMFGYKSDFFVPTNGPFNNTLEETLHNNCIKYIGASKIQHEPIGKGKHRKQFHYLGQQNRHKQTYLTRNCFFEPSSSEKSDWVSSCLAEIDSAFRWNKPAVISTHRVNYVGTLNLKNRDKGLSQLEILLSNIIKRWPDVEFLTSDQLGNRLTK